MDIPKEVIGKTIKSIENDEHDYAIIKFEDGSKLSVSAGYDYGFGANLDFSLIKDRTKKDNLRGKPFHAAIYDDKSFWPYLGLMDQISGKSKSIDVCNMTGGRQQGKLHESVIEFCGMVEHALHRCLAINGGSLEDVDHIVYNDSSPSSGLSTTIGDKLLGEYLYNDELMFEVTRNGLTYQLTFSEKYKP